MVRKSIGVRILCVVGLMVCAGRGGRAGGVPLLISEFRTSGPGGPTDEYIEVFNTFYYSHTVGATSGSGYGIAASDGITRCTIPNGTVIPAGGHFLCVNSSGYSLASVPAGTGTTATGDVTYTRDIPDNSGIALFDNNTGGASYSIATRVDAVGPASENNTVYREGAGYPARPAQKPRESAWVRVTYGSCATGTCTAQSSPVYRTGLVDNDDNATDFYYTDTTGGVGPDGVAQRLGAPGPQNVSAPGLSVFGAGLFVQRVSGCSSSDMPPNRVRDLTPGPAETSPLGTLDLRMKWSNAGSPITRLRFRVVDLTTSPAAPGTADLRVISSSSTLFSIDNYPCGSSEPALLTGTTLEQPPAQPGGGGFNSSLRVTGSSRFASGASINVRVTLGVVQNGFARFCIVPETEPAVAGTPWCYVGSTDALTDLAPRGDYDGDRAAEMAVYDPASVRWTIRQSFGGFSNQIVVPFSTDDQGGMPVAGDYDGDGRVDPMLYIRATGRWVGAISRFGYHDQFFYALGGPGWDPVPGDYDGDGTIDPAVANMTLRRWKFLPSSAITGELVEREIGNYGDTPIGGQDFDGDGLADMVVYNARTSVWTHLQSSSDFRIAVRQQLGDGVGETPVPGDYDGDLQADYAVYQRATGRWLILLSGRSPTSPYPPYTVRFSGSFGGPGFVPVPADYDGDGKTDFAVHQAAATRWIALTSSTGYSPSTPLLVTFGTTDDRPIGNAVLPALTREIRASDADDDGVSDLTVYDTTTGIWSALLSSGGFMNPPMTGSRGGTGYTAVPGDYDGDGRRDLGVYGDATGHWEILRSDSSFTSAYPGEAGGVGWLPVPGDYDGDGRTDMIVYNTTTGQWYGRGSRDDFATTAVNVNWGGSGLTAAPGDFDGDGKIDLCFYQGTTGNWFVKTSTSNYASGFGRHFGEPGNIPIPADFDGDGITDFAVYNPATEYWTILRSDTGNTLAYSRRFGGGTLTPVAGDWDGDRRADIGIYDNATGNWSILLSGTGFMGSLPRTLGGAGRVPVPTFPRFP